MAYSYKYDESGLTTSYLLLSFIVPLSLWYTWTLRLKSNHTHLICNTKGCRKSSSRIWGYTKSSALWIVVSILLYNITHIQTEDTRGVDPHDVLGVGVSTPTRALKKALVKKLKEYKEKNAPEGKKEEYEKMTQEIYKAYNLVKDKDRYEEWLSKPCIGEVVAIPNIIIRNSYLALLFYGVVVGFFLPKFAYKKWTSMKTKNSLGVEYETMDVFMKYINDDLNKKTDTPYFCRNMVWILSKSKELSCHSFRSDVSTIKGLVESEFGCPLPDTKNCNKGFLVLTDHLFRLKVALDDEVEYVREKALLLVEGIKCICICKGYTDILKKIFVLQSMITQAVCDEKMGMLQCPHVKYSDLFLLRMHKQKKEKMTESSVLEKVLSGADLKNALRVQSMIPSVKVDRVEAVLMNTGECCDVSDVEDDENSPDMSTISGAYKIVKGSLMTIRVSLSSTQTTQVVHTHYIDKSIVNNWTVFITLDNVLYQKYVIHEKGKEDIFFEVQSPTNRGSSELRVYVLSGHYFGNSVEESITIKYI